MRLTGHYNPIITTTTATTTTQLLLRSRWDVTACCTQSRKEAGRTSFKSSFPASFGKQAKGTRAFSM